MSKADQATLHADRLAVKATGLAPMMFDRFETMEGDIAPKKKLYLDGDFVCLPAENIYSFLASELGGKSCAAVFQGKARKPFMNDVLSSVVVAPEMPRFTRDGKPVRFGGFDGDGRDKRSGIYIRHDKALVKKSGGLIIPNPKMRPVLPLPWELEFEVSLWNTARKLTVEILTRWLVEGGVAVGFGTYRPRFGRCVMEVELIE